MSRRHIALLLALILLFGAGVETVVRLGLGRISRIQRRTQGEYAAATRTAGPASVLLVGNSLLGEGVDMDDLRRRVGPDVDVHRFFVDATIYYDWLYGLRHLFHQGARPRAVVVFMSGRQWLTTAVRGEVTAGLMFDRRDVPRIAADVRLDHTQASNLLFATFSQYYANRMDVRKWLLGMIVPGLQQLGEKLRPPSPPLPPDDEIVQRALPRIEALRDLCAAHGARLVLVVPPTPAPHSGATAIAAAGARAGVDAWLPIDEHQLGIENYSDGFHLNARGRAQFTAALAPLMKDALRPTTTSH